MATIRRCSDAVMIWNGDQPKNVDVVLWFDNETLKLWREIQSELDKEIPAPTGGKDKWL